MNEIGQPLKVCKYVKCMRKPRFRASIATVGTIVVMKAIVIFLALLAIGKIGYQEYLFRTATKDVIVNAYRGRAVSACQKDARAQRMRTDGRNWSRPSSLKLVIGKSNLDVYFWQINSNLWNARYRNPYLFLSVNQAMSSLFCEYDIVHGSASVYRM